MYALGAGRSQRAAPKRRCGRAPGNLVHVCVGQLHELRDLLRAAVGAGAGRTWQGASDAPACANLGWLLHAWVQVMRSVRCGGSCALGLCGVACGRVDCFYEIGFGGCWDVAAGALIAREAHAAVLDPAGGRFGIMARRVLACSPALAQQVAQVLREVGHSASEPGPPPT